MEFNIEKVLVILGLIWVVSLISYGIKKMIDKFWK
jgi:hypothetical protein